MTGNVDAETLIKKLSRSGKLAELLPQEKASVEKKDNKSAKSKGDGAKEKEPSLNQKKTESPAVNEDVQKGPVSDNNNNDQGKEACSQKKKNKKKSKGQNGPIPSNNINSDDSINEGAGEDNTTKLEALPVTSINPRPPLPPPCPYPPQQQYFAPPQPQPYQHGLSYSTAYPISSSSYYAPNLMHSHYDNPYHRLPPPPPPSDPFSHRHVGHDEYEAVCSIM